MSAAQLLPAFEGLHRAMRFRKNQPTLAQAVILLRVAAAPGKTMSEYIEGVFSDAAMTGAADLLCGLKYLERRPCEKRRSAIRVYPTEKGLDLIAKLAGKEGAQ